MRNTGIKRHNPEVCGAAALYKFMQEVEKPIIQRSAIKKQVVQTPKIEIPVSKKRSLSLTDDEEHASKKRVSETTRYDNNNDDDDKYIFKTRPCNNTQGDNDITCIIQQFEMFKAYDTYIGQNINNAPIESFIRYVDSLCNSKIVNIDDLLHKIKLLRNDLQTKLIHLLNPTSKLVDGIICEYETKYQRFRNENTEGNLPLKVSMQRNLRNDTVRTLFSLCILVNVMNAEYFKQFPFDIRVAADTALASQLFVSDVFFVHVLLTHLLYQNVHRINVVYYSNDLQCMCTYMQSLGDIFNKDHIVSEQLAEL